MVDISTFKKILADGRIEYRIRWRRDLNDSRGKLIKKLEKLGYIVPNFEKFPGRYDLLLDIRFWRHNNKVFLVSKDDWMVYDKEENSISVVGYTKRVIGGPPGNPIYEEITQIRGKL